MPPNRYLLISIAIQSEELLHHIRRVCDVARFIVLAYRLRGGEKLVVRRDDIIMGDGEHVAVIPAQQLQLYKPVAVAAAEFWEIGGGGAVGVGGLFLIAQIILGDIVVHDLVKRLIGRQDVPI